MRWERKRSIYASSPWDERNTGTIGADSHYAVKSTRELGHLESRESPLLAWLYVKKMGSVKNPFGYAQAAGSLPEGGILSDLNP